MAGYSGTPLFKKLGLVGSITLLVVDAPDEYLSWLGPLPDGVRIVKRKKEPEAVHVFVRERDELATLLTQFRKTLRPDGFLWVSWPKKASKVPTTVTEDVIRALALPLGWVDVKVCAVSETWSGLKLVIRKELRP